MTIFPQTLAPSRGTQPVIITGRPHTAALQTTAENPFPRWRRSQLAGSIVCLWTTGASNDCTITYYLLVGVSDGEARNDARFLTVDSSRAKLDG